MIYIKDVTLQDVDVMILPVCEEVATDKTLETLMATKTFVGKKNEVFCSPQIGDTVKYTIYVGVGNKEEMTAEDFRKAVAEGAKKAHALKAKTVGVQLLVTDKICVGGNVKGITEAIYLSTYQFNKYKTSEAEEAAKNRFDVFDIYLSGVPAEKVVRAGEVLQETLHVVEGVMIARDLVNEPSNVIYPETLAQRVVEMGKEANLEVQVMDENEIKALGMEAFLTVGMGSVRKPRLIVMRHMGAPESNEILGLVGKGLTYDTGGYSLKPTDSMKTMHSDMGGAGAVIGAMSVIAKNKVPKNVIAVVAACENAISGESYKPGDIINSMAGKTIEIGNTDAEGRLTLADAMTYIIEKEKVTEVIDLATLTGAALIALGTSVTAVLTNDDAFYNRLEKAAEGAGEHFWKLPSLEEYRALNKSTVADLKNIGGRNAGTITAGLFVGEFNQGLPWIHLDIAGTAWSDKACGYLPAGGTGVPVRTLYNLVKTPCGCHTKH